MGTHYIGSEEDVLALDVYIKLSRAADAVTMRINAHLADYNLTISQFGVLESIYHLGPLYQNQLAQKILKSSGNMTLVIDNLVKRDLVERIRDQKDRRYVAIHLTENGRSLIETIFPKHVQIVVEEMNTLSSSEQSELAHLCRKVGIGKQDSSE